MINTIVVFVGGTGSRLGSILDIDSAPKCYQRFNNVCVITDTLCELYRLGLNNVIMLANGSHKEYTRVVEDELRRIGLNVSVLYEKDRGGTLKALIKAQCFLPETFAVCNGDTLLRLYGLDCRDLYIERGMMAKVFMAQKPRCQTHDDRVAEKEMEYYSKEYGEDWVSTGFALISSFALNEVANTLERREIENVEDSLYPLLDKMNYLSRINLDKAEFHDIGVPERFYKTKEWLCKNQRKILFLDRDGTLNHDEGYTYKYLDGILIKNVVERAADFFRDGWMLVVISNQSGVARGLYSIDEASGFNRSLRDEVLSLYGVNITEFQMCTHLPAIDSDGIFKEDCGCRKPNPKLITDSIEKFSVYAKDCLFVGDSASDQEAALNAGVRFIHTKDFG